MISTIDIRGRRAAGQRVDYRRLVPRAQLDVDAAIEVVRPLCEEVRLTGKAALVRHALAFDQVEIDEVRVPEPALASALAGLDPDVRVALEESVERLRRTCATELPSTVVTHVSPGGPSPSATYLSVGWACTFPPRRPR